MPKRSKADAKALRVRNTIVAFITLVAILVIAYGTMYSTGVTEGDIAEDSHYQIIEGAEVPASGPVQVDEYFSYMCIHCRNFDPHIEEWRDAQSSDVAFNRRPVSFSPVWALMAQTYVTLVRLDALDANHERLFRAIHDQGKQFLSPDMVADYVTGVDRAEFLREFNSPTVRREIARIDNDRALLGVTSVPALVVAGKYVVNMDVGRKQSLDVVDHLIAKVLAERAES